MAGQPPASHRWRAGIATAGWNGKKAQQAKLKESNSRGKSSKKKEEEGEGLKQVERVKWNVWRNFLIAAAASKRKSKLVDSWSSIKSEILVLLKNRKQLLFDQYLANALLHDKTDIRRCRCPDQTGRVRFLGTF